MDNISYTTIYHNLHKFNTKISNNNLHNFWIIAERSDFKPLKNSNNIPITLTSDIISFLKDKFDYYTNKKFINIKIIFNNLLINKFKNIQNWNKLEFNKIKFKGIFIIKFSVFTISNPDIKSNFSKNIKFINVKYNLNDLSSFIPKFKSIEVLTRLILDKNITTSSNNINYSDIIIK
jgi:hypothetical protein